MINWPFSHFEIGAEERNVSRHFLLVVLLAVFPGTLGYVETAYANAPFQENQESGKKNPITDSEPLPGVATAGECADLFLNSILDGDQKTMDRVALCRTELDRIAINTVLRFGAAADRFREKLIEVHGQEAWEKFNDPTHVPFENATASANGAITVIEREKIQAIVAEAEQNATANESWAMIPDNEHRLELIKKDGRWFVKSETLGGQSDPEEIRKVTNFLGSFAVEIERLYHAIGMEGVKPDDIDFELGISMLQIFGAEEFKNVPHRIDVDSLPKPEPFETVGELPRLLNLDANDLPRYLEKGNEFCDSFLKQPAKQFISNLDPKLQSYVSPKLVQQATQNIKKALGTNDKIEIVLNEANYEIGAGVVVSGTLRGSGKTLPIQLFELNGQWIGLKIESESFGFDSRTLSAGTEPLVKIHNEFIKSFFADDIGSAWKIINPDEEATGPDYETLKGELQKFANAVPKNMVWQRSDHLATHVVAKDDELFLRTIGYHNYVHENGEFRKRSMTELMAGRIPDGLWSYRIGAMEDKLLLHQYDAQDALFTALGSGAGFDFIKEHSSFDMTRIQTSVVNAYFQQFRDTYGSFKSVERSAFKAGADFGSQRPVVTGKGRVRFEKGELIVSCEHHRGKLVSFGTEETSDEMMQYPSRISDVTELDEFSRRFIQALLSEQPDDAAYMMDTDLRNQFGDTSTWAESFASFREANGKFKSLKSTHTEYDKEMREWKFNYEIECEKRSLTGDIVLSFSILSCEVAEFNVKPVESPKADSDSDPEATKEPPETESQQ